MQPILSIDGLVKRFGALLVTDHVDLDVQAGEIHAIIGPNGAGKTTLINQIMGELSSDEGHISLNGQSIDTKNMAQRVRAGIGRSYQITSVIPQFTVLENVILAVQGCKGHGFYFWTAATRTTELLDRADQLIDTMGLSTERKSAARTLSYGQQRQLEIAMALASEPKVLLLDEPMAGMGHGDTGSNMILELLQRLKKRYGILLIEHDMDAVFSLADRISVLVYGKVICSGDAETIRNSVEVREAYLGEEELPA